TSPPATASAPPVSPPAHTETSTPSLHDALPIFTVTDTLPTTAGTSWSIDAAGSTAGCSITTGTLTCNFGTLAAGGSAHVHLTSRSAHPTSEPQTRRESVTRRNDGTANAGPTTIT